MHPGSALLAQLAEPLDRSRRRELRSPEALDEVPAPAHAERLERPKLAVDGAVPAAIPSAAHAVARDDPLPLEEELGERPPIGSSLESLERRARAASDQRPCVGDATCAARAREPPSRAAPVAAAS